ncbi:MAG: CHAT domain-containing protein [Thermodesulfobacteriota bacterium]|nr:CHAT domain-containing protein [Thermodesulfobacteriota bacterium]
MVFAQEKRWFLILLTTVLVIVSGCAHLETEKFFNQGRYGDALDLLKEKVPDPSQARANQLVWICQANYKMKRYADLFSSLDLLEKRIQAGDRYMEGDVNSILGTMTSFPHDLSVTPHLIRAEALIETGRYTEATAQARKAYETALSMKWSMADLQVNWHRKCRIRALGLLSAACAFDGNMAESLRYTETLEKEWPGFMGGYLVRKEKDFALGRAYMAQKRYEKVLEFHADFLMGFAHVFSFGIVKAMEDKVFAFVELPRDFVKNKALFETGRIKDAAKGYDRLLARPEARDNGELYWVILFDRGRIYEEAGDRKKAIELYKKAADVIESQRSTINSEASKIGFVGDKQDVYYRLVNNLYLEKDFRSAFTYAERAKARTLVDLLASAAVSSLADPLAGEMLVAELNDLERQGAVFESSDDNAGASRTRSVQIKETIKARNPELASLISVDPPSPARVQARLNADETLIEYFLQGGDLFIFVMTAHNLIAVKADGRDLDDLVRRYRREAQNPDGSGHLAVARALYDRLIVPVSSFLGTRKLLVVPHGVLHYLPFGALRGSQGYVIEYYNLALLPSAATLAYLAPREGDAAGGMLVVSNPDLRSPAYDLKFADREAEKIAALFPGARRISRREATKDAFMGLAGGFDYIHVAAHGIFNADAPVNSGILMAGHGPGGDMLRMTDLYAMRLKADLVTLSACETALGRVSPGDDVIGLTRGFMYAGARSIVASLWPVDDEATSVFMGAFYTALRSTDKAEALQAAQLALMQQYPHPYFWAPFQLTGLRN